MPIIFMISGIFELLIIFDAIAFKKNTSKIFSIIFLMLFMLSFFIGDVSICDITFNVIQGFIFLLLFFVFAVRIRFRLVLLSMLIILTYYFFTTNSFAFVIDKNVVAFVCLLLGSVASNGIKQKVGTVVLLSYGILIIDVVSEYGMVTFATVSFVNLFTLMLKVFLVDTVIRKIIGGINYEIKNNSNAFNCRFWNFVNFRH